MAFLYWASWGLSFSCAPNVFTHWTITHRIAPLPNTHWETNSTWRLDLEVFQKVDDHDSRLNDHFTGRMSYCKLSLHLHFDRVTSPHKLRPFVTSRELHILYQESWFRVPNIVLNCVRDSVNISPRIKWDKSNIRFKTRISAYTPTTTWIN